MPKSASKPLLASSNGTPIANATTTLIADPGDGVRIRIRRIVVSNGNSTGTWCQSLEGGGTKNYNGGLQQGGWADLEFRRPWDLTASTAFTMVTSAAGSVEYTVEYQLIPV